LNFRSKIFDDILFFLLLGRRSAAISYDRKLGEVPRGTITTLSWSPRVFLWKGFLTPEECNHIIQKALPLLTRSKVAGRGFDSVLSQIESFHSSMRQRFERFVNRRLNGFCMYNLKQTVLMWRAIGAHRMELSSHHFVMILL
jgi:hypothetical protein